ncbi:MAG TPA: hypothetical protein VJN72_06020, partial [Gaiellales bacterium]|nr:hypothetical protein [Gaiellales bacterium]
ALLLVALIAVGCGGGSTPLTAGLVRTDGILLRVGGPAPGDPVAMPGVRLHFQGGAGSADVRTDRHGRFGFRLAPGTYTVHVLSGGLPPTTAPHTIHLPHAGRLRLVVSIK